MPFTLFSTYISTDDFKSRKLAGGQSIDGIQISPVLHTSVCVYVLVIMTTMKTQNASTTTGMFLMLPRLLML